jgi:Fe-S cluster biogenesis protein NfuA
MMFDLVSKRTGKLTLVYLFLSFGANSLSLSHAFVVNSSGDVRLVAINGTEVQLELQGACSSCASSTTTMQLGIESRLMSRIPSISKVTQVFPVGPTMTAEAVDEVLDTVRPFLDIAGATVHVVDVQTDLQPLVILHMSGGALALRSIQIEITQRLQRHFAANVKVEWQC